MDSRIAVAAVSSYLTSFRELLPGNGPQDAEQTLPGFIAAGLDFADWVELAAPRPYAVVAFEGGFLPRSRAHSRPSPRHRDSTDTSVRRHRWN